MIHYQDFKLRSPLPGTPPNFFVLFLFLKLHVVKKKKKWSRILSLSALICIQPPVMWLWSSSHPEMEFISSESGWAVTCYGQQDVKEWRVLVPNLVLEKPCSFCLLSGNPAFTMEQAQASLLTDRDHTEQTPVSPVVPDTKESPVWIISHPTDSQTQSKTFRAKVKFYWCLPLRLCCSALQHHGTLGTLLDIVQQSMFTASPSLLSVPPAHPPSVVSHDFLSTFILEQMFKHR